MIFANVLFLMDTIHIQIKGANSNGRERYEKTIFLILVTILLTVSTAQATNIFNSEVDFLNNINPTYYLEDFVGYTYRSPLDGEAFANFGPVNGFSWQSTAPPSGLFSLISSLSTKDSLDQLIITFTGSPVTAVGGIFSSTDIDGNLLAQDIFVQLSDGTNVTYSGSGFAGFTSYVPFVSISIDGIDNPGDNWPQVDHFYVGSAEPVPEPATLLLLGTGLVGFAGTARRKA